MNEKEKNCEKEIEEKKNGNMNVWRRHYENI